MNTIIVWSRPPIAGLLQPGKVCSHGVSVPISTPLKALLTIVTELFIASTAFIVSIFVFLLFAVAALDD